MNNEQKAIKQKRKSKNKPLVTETTRAEEQHGGGKNHHGKVGTCPVRADSKGPAPYSKQEKTGRAKRGKQKNLSQGETNNRLLVEGVVQRLDEWNKKEKRPTVQKVGVCCVLWGVLLKQVKHAQ